MGGGSSCDRTTSIPCDDLSDISFDYKPLTNEVGVVYVVTNDYHYDAKMVLRDHGVDRKNMERFFDNTIEKYYVMTAQNRTREKFISTLQYLANWPNYPPSCKRIIVYFAGHGSDGYITMEKDVKTASSDVKINEILSIFRTDIGKKMVKLILLDACCNVQDVACEEGSNELVACAASEGFAAESDPCIGGYWTHELRLMLTEKQDCDLVTVLQSVKNKMEKDTKYPLYKKGKYMGLTNLSPSFKNGLVEPEKNFCRQKGMYMNYIYHFDTSHQRKPQGYISNIPWEQVYIMIYPAAMVTSQ